jgi:hypothetical protein
MKTSAQILHDELSEMIPFPERNYLLMRTKELIEKDQIQIMKAYADGIKALRDSITTDEVYDSYLEYYNKNYNQ